MDRDYLNTYEDVASEYYDRRLHPTCANFREASHQLVSRWLPDYIANSDWLCEVGVGKSLLAELLIGDSKSLDRLVLVDQSPTMLEYSRQWVTYGSHLVIGSAWMLPIRSGSVSFLLASVGDPYNQPAFWKEVYRVLEGHGVAVYTTPAYEWVAVFRAQMNNNKKMMADFELADGTRLYLPSWIYPEDEQKEMFRGEKLFLKEKVCVRIADLQSESLSPKLRPDRGPEAKVVTGYVVAKAG